MLEKVFAAFEPVTGDIILVGSSRPTKGSVKVIIDMNDYGETLWAMPSSPDAKYALALAMRDLARRFIKAGYRTVYLTLYEFEQDAPGRS